MRMDGVVFSMSAHRNHLQYSLERRWKEFWSEVSNYPPLDPRFAGSNPTDIDGFFEDIEILSTSPPGGTLSRESRV